MLFATMLHREYRTYSESKHLYDSQLNRGFRVHWVIPVNAYRRNASLSNRETNARQCIKACYWGSQLTLATIVTVTHQEITGSMHRRSYHSEVYTHTHPYRFVLARESGKGPVIQIKSSRMYHSWIQMSDHTIRLYDWFNDIYSIRTISNKSIRVSTLPVYVRQKT